MYSAALLNTTREHRRTGRRTPETGRNGRDTPRLYALYSVVFRCHLHTKSARKLYSRKGFGICIQCIQRIPTPFVFRLSLLLEPEYMNTVNTIRPGGTRHDGCMRRIGLARDSGFVFSAFGEYRIRSKPNGAGSARIGPKGVRHAPVVCIVFSCIQMPNAYKISPLALLP